MTTESVEVTCRIELAEENLIKPVDFSTKDVDLF